MDFYLINKIWFNYAINKKVYMNSFLNNNFIKDYDNQHFLHPWEDCRTDNSAVSYTHLTLPTKA